MFGQLDTGREGDAAPQLEVLGGGWANIWDYQIHVGASPRGFLSLLPAQDKQSGTVQFIQSLW